MGRHGIGDVAPDLFRAMAASESSASSHSNHVPLPKKTSPGARPSMPLQLMSAHSSGIAPAAPADFF
jgi:hypothetical protein